MTTTFYFKPKPRSPKRGDSIGTLRITPTRKQFVFDADPGAVIRMCRDNMSRVVVLADFGTGFTGSQFLRMAGLDSFYLHDQECRAEPVMLSYPPLRAVK